TATNDPGRVFDDKRLTGLIGDDESVYVDPVVGPGTEFSIEEAADRNNRNLRHRRLGARARNDLLDARHKDDGSFQAMNVRLARVDAMNRDIAIEQGFEVAGDRRSENVRECI